MTVLERRGWVGREELLDGESRARGRGRGLCADTKNTSSGNLCERRLKQAG